MRKFYSAAVLVAMVCIVFIFSKCNNKPGEEVIIKDSTIVIKDATGGFDSQVKWGEHLVLICGCNDCHTPKKMGAHGPEPDMENALSGHPSQMPIPPVDRKDVESKGLGVTNDLTAWVGPWGVSFAANITSDSTGIGNWKEDQFINCLRKGKWMGMDDARTLLPPMPWQSFSIGMSDGELKAIFAYLKSTKPIHNIIPPAMPPVTAMK